MLSQKNLCVFLAFLLLISCSTETNTSREFIYTEKILDSIEVLSSSAISNFDSALVISYTDSLNYTDENGLKQGIWKKEWNGVLVEKMMYVDDVLHGHYEREYEEGHYINGEKDGLIYHYYGKKESLMMLSYFENGKFIWSGFPTAGREIFVPIKEFHIERDSLYIEANFINGKTWYKGHFNKDAPYGFHEVYFFDGQLKGTLDFENEIIQEFDSLGNQLYETSFDDWETHQQPIQFFNKYSL